MLDSDHTPETVSLACLEHCARPTLDYTLIPPEDFIGLMVRVGFQGVNDRGEEKTEYLWLDVIDVWVFVEGVCLEVSRYDELLGIIDNVPVLKMPFKCRGRVSFRRDEIVDDRDPVDVECCEHDHVRVSTSDPEVRN